MADTGTLRLQYRGKKTVFEYPRMKRSDVPEKIAEHRAHYPVDAAPTPDAADRKLDGTGFDTVAFPPLIAHWVENPGAPTEVVTPIEVPA